MIINNLIKNKAFFSASFIALWSKNLQIFMISKIKYPCPKINFIFFIGHPGSQTSVVCFGARNQVFTF
jgi:hypothetical protein